MNQALSIIGERLVKLLQRLRGAKVLREDQNGAEAKPSSYETKKSDVELHLVMK
ncbi:hypothetical protein EVJ58_g6358 [Rhodofomes roseus]|uniref:Uncharacterized protein n=1 Tax=Rhodofomes roseus TaxID=34475 RepID=A0A4Y9YCG1_9APHY|nr:hypothetical protein EVJ58_g6358 [Rhodofomes roseus]